MPLTETKGKRVGEKCLIKKLFQEEVKHKSLMFCKHEKIRSTKGGGSESVWHHAGLKLLF